jgi:hypothetical protein
LRVSHPLPQPPPDQLEVLPHDGLLNRLTVRRKLVPDRRSNEIAAIGIEAVPHQQVDLTKVDVAEIDRDLLGVQGSVAQRCQRGHILSPSKWMVDRHPSRAPLSTETWAWDEQAGVAATKAV